MEGEAGVGVQGVLSEDATVVFSTDERDWSRVPAGEQFQQKTEMCTGIEAGKSLKLLTDKNMTTIVGTQSTTRRVWAGGHRATGSQQ